jgi:hypothetical protein
MLLALIIGAAAVVAFICSFAMFLQYIVRMQTMTATQTPLRREPCSTRRGRILIADAASSRAINEKSPATQFIVRCTNADPSVITHI